MAVWLCSGQGAQKPGMGADLLYIEEVADTFKQMSEGLNLDLIKIAKDGTEDEINEPKTAQSLTMAVSVGVGLALKARGIMPDALVGFSLGQISALVLADVLPLKDAIDLLRVRTSSMAQACAMNPGGMVALMGATLKEAEDLCAESAEGDVLVCANHNAPGQIVISGHDSALARAQELWKEAGHKSVRLNTAGAFHSPLMEQAAQEVETFCESLNFAEPSVTLICNTDARPFVIKEAAKRLGKQVKEGVLFEQSIRALLDDGYTDFVEVGFGGVLTSLVRKIDKTTNRHKIGTAEEFESYIESVKQQL